MPLDFDPSADFAQVADGAEMATLLRRSFAGAAPLVAHALRQALTVSNPAALRSGGRYLPGDTIWHLAAAELDTGPRPGDVLVDNRGRRWTIVEVQQGTLDGRWRCVARDVAAAYDLGETVTILRSAESKTASGAAEPSWHIWKTGIRAKIQPIASEVTSEHLTQQTVARYQISLESDLALDHTHRIQSADGTCYTILGSTAAQQPGELQTIDAELA